MKKIVLAFSGGLDTSYCALYLSKELKYDVYAVTINTGGFTNEEAKTLQSKAQNLGVKSYEFLDCTENFYNKAVKYLLFGNVLKNNTYPLSVSSERVFQAQAIAEYAQKINADAISHGSTGAGNDQVRFDTIFHVLCPNMDIITPIRDLKLSREEEISYLQKQGVSDNWEQALYSINKGLWGTSIGGKETLTSIKSLPESAYPIPISKKESATLTIHFEKGEPVALNNKKAKPLALIQELDKMAAPYGIGRDTHVGDTLIGIKGRVGFMAAAPILLIKSHHLLEKHTLSKNQLFIKSQLEQWYGQLMHEGKYLDPAMRDIEAFFSESQKYVTGEVSIRLFPYRFSLEGIQSPHDLMDHKFGMYGEKNDDWDGNDARGFSKILSNEMKIYYHKNEKN